MIDLIVGARPNFMKIAPIIHALEAKKQEKVHLDYRLIHTGQHYDRKLSTTFFDQLDIPQPEINFDVGSNSSAQQTADIMVSYEKLLLESPSDLCLVVGDVNSTMATALVAQKLHIPVAHVEAGIRSNDWQMPEEINRLVTDAITNWFFTTSKSAGENLKHAGIDGSRIHFVGNTMIDTLLRNLGNLRAPEFWNDLELESGEYLVLTMHRPSNVDDLTLFNSWLQAISVEAKNLTVVFPVHPRTARILEENGSLPENIRTVEPQSYFEFNYLVKNARAVLTDSGGITEEATVLDVPCLTLRDSTERPETVEIGTNVLVGSDPKGLAKHMKCLRDGIWKKSSIPEKWDGKAGLRIVKVLDELLAGKVNIEN